MTNLAADAPNLYNGNIKSMVTTITNPATGAVLPQLTAYRYDQLNRIKGMKAFDDINLASNEWNYSTYAGRYQNDFSYDANGNMETAVAKNANGEILDDQTYRYYTLDGSIGGKKTNNRLYCINDVANNCENDIPAGQVSYDNAHLGNNNYGYNELGELVFDKQGEIAEIKWSAYGKIRGINRIATSGKMNVWFDYDAAGNRIAKRVYNPDNSLYKTEYYVRDATGNIMSTYELTMDNQNEITSYAQTERPIYGTSQLGMDRTKIELISSIPNNELYTYRLGLKQYTGSNHLGNTLTVFTDKKIPVDDNSDGIIDYYKADIVSSNDYAPFGGLLSECSFNTGAYPNTFNGKRDDPELDGWQDYGMRMYSPWMRRFVTVDPLIVQQHKYPELSPYQFASNSPIMSIDLDGLEAISVSFICLDNGNTLVRINNDLEVEDNVNCRLQVKISGQYFNDGQTRTFIGSWGSKELDERMKTFEYRPGSDFYLDGQRINTNSPPIGSNHMTSLNWIINDTQFDPQKITNEEVMTVRYGIGKDDNKLKRMGEIVESMKIQFNQTKQNNETYTLDEINLYSSDPNDATILNQVLKNEGFTVQVNYFDKSNSSSEMIQVEGKYSDNSDDETQTGDNNISSNYDIKCDN